jgi:hypothetical protein
MKEARDGNEDRARRGVDDMLRELFPDLDPAVVRRVLGMDAEPATDEAEEEDQ